MWDPSNLRFSRPKEGFLLARFDSLSCLEPHCAPSLPSATFLLSRGHLHDVVAQCGVSSTDMDVRQRHLHVVRDALKLFSLLF
jgi:hypothetical protein